jgi:hypothetical protein
LCAALVTASAEEAILHPWVSSTAASGMLISALRALRIVNITQVYMLEGEEEELAWGRTDEGCRSSTSGPRQSVGNQSEVRDIATVKDVLV